MSCYQRRLEQKELRVQLPTVANKRLKKGGNMLNHIEEFEQLYDRLDSMGDAVVEGQRVPTLLASLGSEYGSIIVALPTIPVELSWDDLTARLQDEYERRESARNEGGAALISSQRKKRGPKCFVCGRYGHIKANCTEKSSRRLDDSDSDDDARKKRRRRDTRPSRRTKRSQKGSMTNHVSGCGY
jgi:hypothetical protein